MTERDRLVDQFEREISGEPWHGPSLTSILDGITAEQAARKPPAGAHSIWEIVLHMTGWKREVARRAEGHPAGEPPLGDWPATGDVSEPRWRKAREDLLRAEHELVKLVRSLPEAGLDAKVTGEATASIGAGISVKATLYGLLQHDVYHAGQIAILKKIGV
ncbi:MAG: DinB family protein [Vicinamibacterales bacterium]